MRLHSNILTAADVYAATISRGMRGVYAEVATVGSRSHARALDVHLSGTSSRRTNPGASYPSREGAGIDYAATWDEWGMVMATLYAIDPAAVWGSVKRPTYANADHFHYVTGGRFHTLTAPDQHGRGGHKWDWQGDGMACKCGATRPHGADARAYAASVTA
jgi:hypothetical protein